MLARAVPTVLQPSCHAQPVARVCLEILGLGAYAISQPRSSLASCMAGWELTVELETEVSSTFISAGVAPAQYVVNNAGIAQWDHLEDVSDEAMIRRVTPA